MKNTFRIYPVLTMKTQIDKGVFTYLRNYGEKIMVPVYAWLIVTSDGPILVDTGCSFEDFMKNSTMSIGGEPGTPIEDFLKNKDITLSDIKTIIITHLHMDHILNGSKFPNATFIVQEEELKFAQNPHPLFAAMFKSEWFQGLNVQTVQGDTEIIPGIKVISTPGHTAGCQSVAITTDEGETVITGFCAIDDNFTDQGVVIPGPHTDPMKAYDSMIKVKNIADRIIPLHSLKMINVESIP